MRSHLFDGQISILSIPNCSFRLNTIIFLQEWEKTRQHHETEHRDELRAMYQLREQEIISQLMQLENKQFDMVGSGLSAIFLFLIVVT